MFSFCKSGFACNYVDHALYITQGSQWMILNHVLSCQITFYHRRKFATYRYPIIRFALKIPEGNLSKRLLDNSLKDRNQLFH